MIAKPTPRAKVRKPLKAKRRGVHPHLAQQVFERDNWTCQWCLVPGGRLDPHHLVRRSQGGKDELLNLVSVHRLCHNYIHEHPTESYGRGFLVRAGEEVVLWLP